MLAGLEELNFVEMAEISSRDVDEHCKSEAAEDGRQWFVMRDLTRTNAKHPAYLMLKELKLRYFTPMVTKLFVRNGRREAVEVPFMQDLIFVYDNREVIDPIVERVGTFQYRFLRNTNREPMTVRKADMERFIRVVESSKSPRYYRPEEITPDMYNRRIRIVGGQLNGYEGTLVTTRGSKAKRLLVELPLLLAAAVEVEPEYIQLLGK